MFFRRDVPKKLGFQDWLAKARTAGYTVETAAGGSTRISKGGVAAIVEEGQDGKASVAESAGVLVGSEIGRLVDGGFQKFIQTPSGKRRAALAGDLTAIHAFQEDLREVLCLPGTYNQSLGTVSNQYIYDRVEQRDHAAAKAPWKIPIFLKKKA